MTGFANTFYICAVLNLPTAFAAVFLPDPTQYRQKLVGESKKIRNILVEDTEQNEALVSSASNNGLNDLSNIATEESREG